MRRAILPFLAASTVLLAACIEGNGKLVCDERVHESFMGVESDVQIPVVVHEADYFAVTVAIDSNLQQVIQTRVEGERLIIRASEPFSNPAHGSQVTVWMPEVRKLSLDGSGQLEATDIRRVLDVEIESDGSGELVFAGPARELRVTHEGSGRIEIATHAAAIDLEQTGSGLAQLEGSADSVAIDSTGSGAIDAEHLEARDLTIECDGSGSVAATSNDGRVDVSIDGSGSIDLYGSSCVHLMHDSGSGSLRRH